MTVVVVAPPVMMSFVAMVDSRSTSSIARPTQTPSRNCAFPVPTAAITSAVIVAAIVFGAASIPSKKKFQPQPPLWSRSPAIVTTNTTTTHS